MKRKTYLKKVNKFWKEIQATRDAGQKEYARDEDNIFANFDRVANCLNIPREKVLMTYLLKHIDGIGSYIDGHKSQREAVSGRITDAVVYLLLLWAMTENKEEEEDDYNPWTVTTT